MKFYSENYKKLELFALSDSGVRGCAEIFDAVSGRRIRKEAGTVRYRYLAFELSEYTEYELNVYNCELSVIYLSECEDILQQGVRFLHWEDKKLESVRDLSRWYDTPLREQYHFSAFKNWINDPNGLCYFKGFYHLFYQANPHEQVWGPMYWGHAASKDLVHWVHLPYVLFPQEEIIDSSEKKGGAFSGSAVTADDRIIFYLTRHIGPSEDSEAQTKQYQTRTESFDGLHFGNEVPVLYKPDQRFSYNFRDPKLFYDNGWHMVLGTRFNGTAAAASFRKDGERWLYEGNIFEEKDVYTIECPDFMRFEDKDIAVGALMYHYDEYGRYQMTKYYAGKYQEGKFQIKNTGWYDFGSNFYAVQSFVHENRTIAIGWVSDFYGEHIAEKNGNCGSMAIPRELYIKDGRLCMKPVREIYSLCTKEPVREAVNCPSFLAEVDGNTYYAQIKINKNSDFDILLGKGKDGSEIRLLKNGEVIRLKTKGVKTENIDFRAQSHSAKLLEIFVDRRLVEVFINGEEAGTKLFYGGGKNGRFEADFKGSRGDVKLYMMESIWHKKVIDK